MSVPESPKALAAWLAEGVEAELEWLQKTKQSVQEYELLSGKLLELAAGTTGIFNFIVTDADRIPEDSVGKIQIASNEYNAVVVAQTDNRINIQIEFPAIPPTTIPRAILKIDATELLKRMAEKMRSLAADEPIGPLCVLPFRPQKAKIGKSKLPQRPQLQEVVDEHRDTIEQVLGSNLTYIWGPPGTGKTFSIAHLVAALVFCGHRVLVTSHTHAAVDQALYETIKNEGPMSRGPLEASDVLLQHKVLRLGRPKDSKIPASVRLDRLIDERNNEIQTKVNEIDYQIVAHHDQINRCQQSQQFWAEMARLKDQSVELDGSRRTTLQRRDKISEDINNVRKQQDRLADELVEAQKSWFWREKKCQKIRNQIGALEMQHRKLAEELRQSMVNLQMTDDHIERLVKQQEALYQGSQEYIPMDQLQKRLNTAESAIRALQQIRDELEAERQRIQEELINGAQVIFCTLTKTYVGAELDKQTFDTVIIDEVSMALPPLIFLAANKATQKAVLVGDFLQLPPIVRSDNEICAERLGTDIFHISQLVVNNRLNGIQPSIASLYRQRRMLPAIASVARHLAYNGSGLTLEDHDNVVQRAQNHEGQNGWLAFLPSNPLVIADTAGLNCWCGKQARTLSRFNFYSARVAVEISAMAASGISRPSSEAERPIGIVTSFAAQKKMVIELVNLHGLDDWVTVGTVHTFQGGQAQLMIYDSVLDEPYWSARLATPKDMPDVIRELNVAVTRAQSKFVFIGSSAWMNVRTKETSGLGRLWTYLKDHADLVAVADLVPQEVILKSLCISEVSDGWQGTLKGQENQFEILNDTTFFDRFLTDIDAAKDYFFGLAPYFGQYRWDRIESHIHAAAVRGVKVTIVTPPLSEASNPAYVNKAVAQLRRYGVVVISSSGLHGKDVIIDDRVLYTGSMNWSSNRGRDEIVHRITAKGYIATCLQYLQARYIRQAAVSPDGSPRVCPICHQTVHVVNMKKQHWQDKSQQPMKIACSNPQCQKYIRNIDERAPFQTVPVCCIDGRTKYRRVQMQRYARWECPKHPKECEKYKVVPGDPEA